MRRATELRTWVSLVLAFLALIAATPAAMAAVGKPLVLGAKNKAAGTTTLVVNTGTPLSLRGPADKPPLSVNSTGRVANLNADQLDGRDSSDFASADDLPADLSGWTIMVAGDSCPVGSAAVGLEGNYGAEDQFAAMFGDYLYVIVEGPLGLGPRLTRAREPLVMSACQVG